MNNDECYLSARLNVTFFFQAEDGIRDLTVTGVQTCALPIAWFATTYPDLTGRTVAYFCAEFGLHTSVPIYSGGLGILAGDQCKAASDLGVPLVGVGLLYTRGYFDQRLRLDGWQEDADERFDVSLTPLERVLGPGGVPSVITVQTGGRAVCVGARSEEHTSELQSQSNLVCR